MGGSAEDRLIHWLRGRLAGGSGTAAGSGPGDDVAFLGLTGDWAATSDQQIPGVHVPPGLDEALIARRLLAVNLSDLAAAGARPRFALSQIAAAPSFDVKRFLGALVSACRSAGVELVGGDVARSSATVTSLTLLGRRAARGRWLARGDLRAGDRIWLGGPVGESRLGRAVLERTAVPARGRPRLPAAGIPQGLRRAAAAALNRHLEPLPQLDLGGWLARRRRCGAIDVSDGLLLDLTRLASAGEVALTIEAGRLPLAPGHDSLADHLGLDPLDASLTGGEDYVLAFGLPPAIRPPAEFGATAIGRALERRPGRRRLAVTGLGGRQLPETSGWDHLA